MTGGFVTRDHSYRSKQAAGNGWVLIGDAFGFLDPLYSSGVLLALRSGEMAANAIAEGLERGDVGGEQPGRWSALFTVGMATRGGSGGAPRLSAREGLRRAGQRDPIVAVSCA